MDNRNKGIGDYIVITILGLIIGFDKFGFEWLGLKTVLFVNVVILFYAVALYVIETIIDKFKR